MKLCFKISKILVDFIESNKFYQCYISFVDSRPNEDKDPNPANIEKVTGIYIMIILFHI